MLTQQSKDLLVFALRSITTEFSQDFLDSLIAQIELELTASITDADITPVALVDNATIDLTDSKHTLTTANGRTFTISHPGDIIIIDITLNATDATFTFPATALCSYAGTASGDNTLPVTGATSGDKINIAVLKVGSNYRVTAQNFGQ